MASTLTSPSVITIPFAEEGNKRSIPNGSLIGVTDGAASFMDGFPPLTMVPLSSGGVPPSGLDFNGVFHAITEHIRYINAGGRPKFSQNMADAIGGYPVGTVLQDNAGENEYVNSVDGNVTNFNLSASSIGVSWHLCGGKDVYPGNASLTDAGIVQLATNTITKAGTNESMAVTPAGMTYAFTSGASSQVQPLPGGFKIQMLTVPHSSLGNNDTISFTYPLPFSSYAFPLLSSTSTLGGETSGNATSEGAEITSSNLTGGVITSYWDSRGSGSFSIVAFGK